MEFQTRPIPDTGILSVCQEGTGGTPEYPA